MRHHRHYNYQITWDEDEQEYRGTCDYEPYKHLSHFDKNPIDTLAGIMTLVFDQEREEEES